MMIQWRAWSPRLSFQRHWWLRFVGLKKCPKRGYLLQKQNKPRDLIDLFLEYENWEPWEYQQDNKDKTWSCAEDLIIQGKRWTTVKHTTHKHIKTSARQHWPAGNQGHHKGQHRRQLPCQIMTPPLHREISYILHHIYSTRNLYWVALRLKNA